MSSNTPDDPLLRRLQGGEHLSADEAAELIGSIIDGSVAGERAAEILVALARKGEHANEVHGAARAMRERAVHVDHGLPVVIDVVGTGGDGSGTINISTIAALVVAAAGVPVAKHGNRAATSTCGSADVLEANGLQLDVGPNVAARMLRETGFTFLFAPRYHPAMKNVGPVRKQVGIRTIFNLLGPLTNPARATHYVIGVARPEFADLVASVLRHQDHVRAAAVVHGEGNVDEVIGTTQVLTLNDRYTIDPHEYGINAGLEDLLGDSVEACARAFRDILSGEQSPRADVVALNAGLALFVAGKAATLRAGFELAQGVIASGQGMRTFEEAKAVARENAVSSRG